MTPPQPAPLGAARRLAGFDGLRALAVTAVMAYHFFLLVAVFPNVATLEVGAQLRVGVWIFFVISGFLLYRPYAAANFGARPRPSLFRYGWARFLRIWPAYAVALLILTFLWHRLDLEGIGRVAVHISLTQNFLQSEFTRGLSPAWSLVVEASFYAFLPLYAAVIARLARVRDAWRVEVAGLVALIGLGFVWQLSTTEHRMFATLLPSFLPTFALGMGLAVAVVHRRSLQLSVLANRGWLCWSGAAVLIIAKGLIGGSDGFHAGFRIENQLVYSSVAFLVVLPAVFGDATTLSNRVLCSRPFRLVGVISYGMFLWSGPVIGAVQLEWIPLEPRFHGRSAVVALVVLVVTMAIATLSWFVVERPALRLKRLVPGDRRRERVGATTPE